MLDPTKTTLPKQWASEFAMALRYRDVTGAAIGDALREAEAYCADSGQAPLEAFGPAAAYADSLTDLPTAAAHTSWAARIAPSALGLAGLTLALPTFDAWRAGRSVQLPLGGLVTLLVIAATVTVFLVWPRTFRRAVPFLILVSLGMWGSVSATALLQQPVATLPTVPSALVAAGALIGSGIWQMRTLDLDVIVDPLGPTPRPGRGFLLLTAWLLPIGTLVAMGIAMFAPVR